MKNLSRVTLGDYKFNAKQSVKAEAPSLNGPGNEAKTALDVSAIYYEDKTSVLKKLKVGDIFEFSIAQDISYTLPNFKNPEQADRDHYCEGTGSGEIKEILALDLSKDDEEYQEVKILLNEGLAEDL